MRKPTETRVRTAESKSEPADAYSPVVTVIRPDLT